MKIFLITQYYPPEVGAPQARLSEMAEEWVRLGHQVIVLTAFPNHPSGIIPEKYNDKYFAIEKRNGVEIWRHWLYATPNEGFLRKNLSHLSFMISLVLLSLKRGDRPDIIIGSSPAFFMMFSVFLISKARNVPYVFEIRDIWPGIFVELNVLKNRFILVILEKIELFLYKNSRLVVPVTHGFLENIASRGIRRKKIKVITNGVDIDYFQPRSVSNGFKNKNGIPSNKKIVLYIGVHGISQGLQSIISAADILKNNVDLFFVFVGDGAEKQSLVESANKKELLNILFIPPQPKENVPLFYNLADIVLVPLKNIKGFDSFIPSKIFEVLACGKPIIASLHGESADILEKSGGALIVEPENPEQLAKSIVELVGDLNKQYVMGKNGRSFVINNYDRKKLAADYLDILSKAKL